MPGLKTKTQVAELMKPDLLRSYPSLPKSFLPQISMHPSMQATAQAAAPRELHARWFGSTTAAKQKCNC